MTVTPNHLTTDGSTDNVFTYTTAPLTPTASRLYLVGLMVGVSATPTPSPSVTGCGLTWDQVTQTVAGFRTVHIFRARATPTAGALTINFGAGNAPNGCVWTVVEYDGADTTGTNGSGAIAQSLNAKPANGTSSSASFAGVPASGSGGFAIAAISAGDTITPGAGWTGVSKSLATPAQSAVGMWASSCPATVSASWTSSVASFLAGVEIKPASAGGTLDKVRLGTSVASLRLGASTVAKAYLGTTQVYP